MGKRQFGNKKDGNHNEIQAVYESIPGCVVEDTADAGNGFPDLVVGWMGNLYMIEIKNPATGGTLTPAEKGFRKKWSGFEYHIVRTEEDVYISLGMDPNPEIPF